MISLCTVIVDNNYSKANILLKSVFRYCPLVSEIIIVGNNPTETYNTEEKVCDCVVRKVSGVGGDYKQQHHLGLHVALDHVSKDYVLFTDPDIFFCMDVAGYYLHLFEKHDLNIVGVTHAFPGDQSYGYFPCVMNCLVRRDRLPGREWMYGHIRLREEVRHTYHYEDTAPLVPGKFLAYGAIRGYTDQFPHQRGLFDVGCNLWLWNKELNGRWLSFGHIRNNYSTIIQQANFPIEECFYNRNLLYHEKGGVRRQNKGLDTSLAFKRRWLKHLMLTPY